MNAWACSTVGKSLVFTSVAKRFHAFAGLAHGEVHGQQNASLQ